MAACCDLGKPDTLTREYDGPRLPTIVAAIPGAAFAPGRPPRVIGPRVVGISRLPALARAVRAIRTGVVRVEELVVRGYSAKRDAATRLLHDP